jgi:single-strand DNA-binding protein
VASLNEVRLIGNLGGDPEVKSLTSGAVVANFRLATNERWKADGKEQSRTDWHTVEVWGAQAKTCAKFLTKGRLVMVVGSLRTDVWADKENCEIKHSRTKVVAQRVLFLDGPDKPELAGDEPAREPVSA